MITPFNKELLSENHKDYLIEVTTRPRLDNPFIERIESFILTSTSKNLKNKVIEEINKRNITYKRIRVIRNNKLILDTNINKTYWYSKFNPQIQAYHYFNFLTRNSEELK